MSFRDADYIIFSNLKDNWTEVSLCSWTLPFILSWDMKKIVLQIYRLYHLFDDLKENERKERVKAVVSTGCCKNVRIFAVHKSLTCPGCKQLTYFSISIDHNFCEFFSWGKPHWFERHRRLKILAELLSLAEGFMSEICEFFRISGFKVDKSLTVSIRIHKLKHCALYWLWNKNWHFRQREG